MLIEQEVPVQHLQSKGKSEVLWESQGVVDRAAGTSTTPADCGLGGEVLWEEQGVVD